MSLRTLASGLDWAFRRRVIGRAALGAGMGGILCMAVAAQEGSSPIDLRLEQGTNFAVARSPDGATLALDLQGTLWTLPAVGGEARALTDGLGDDRLPDYSPDGSRLVFQSYRRGSWDIWMIGTDGSALEPLTEGASDDREPAWSPDGTRVAFSSDRSGNYDVWVLRLADGELTQLTTNEADEYMPTWSPSGREIAFLSDRGELGTTELRKIGVTGGEETRVALLEGKPASPSWSPDGRQIALQILQERVHEISSWRFSEGVAADLVVVPAQGGAPAKQTSGEDVFPFRPQWIPGGGLLYTSDGHIRRLPAGRGSPETIPFSASVTLERPAYPRREASTPEGRVPVRGIVGPALSPNGEQIAFSALGDIWVARADGLDPVLLTRDEYLDSDPSWSPDGRDIVFSSDRGGTMDLWRKKSDAAPGGEATRLAELPGAELNPAWSPDGQWIAFTDENDNLYVVPAQGGRARLVRTSRRWAGSPSWSSDSDHLVLAALETGSKRFREGVNRLVVVSMSTGEERTIELDGQWSGQSISSRTGDGPSWSPDGQRLAFAMNGGLYVLPVTPAGEPTGAPRRVFDSPIQFPHWSPDSRSVLFLAADKLTRADVEGERTHEIPLDLSYRVRAPVGSMVIRNARVIDGTGAPPRDDVDIFIDAGRIESVIPSGSETAEDIPSIDATGKTVIPGLIDMHTHLTLPDFGSRQGQLWLAFGVTSIRVTGGSIYRTLEERESIDAGRRIGPRVFATGFALDGGRVYYPDYVAVDSEEELLRELRRAFRLDYDLVKTYVRFPDELQRTTVEEAHRRGVFVTSHEMYPAVAFGVDGIEHLRGTSRRGFSPKISALRRSYQDVIDLVSRSGAYFTPTILIEGGLQLALARDPELVADSRLTTLLPPWALDALRRIPVGDVAEREEVMAPMFETLRAIAAAGGRIVAGADSPVVPYGLGLVLEVEQMSESGMGPLEAIRSATQVAAEGLGASRDLGSIRPGRFADLVLLDGDPMADIRNLRRVEGVMSRGRYVRIEHLLDPGSR